MGTGSLVLLREYCTFRKDMEAHATRVRQKRKENEKSSRKDAKTQNIPSKMDDFI
jgi:hypothetical protein